jgi:hypothetical protein
MPSGFDPGAGQSASGRIRFGLKQSTTYHERGAPYDHIWLNGTSRGQVKYLTIVFPTTDGDVPVGVRADPVSLDPTGKTSSAIYEMFVNPQQVQISYPTRTQVIQTIGGAYTDSFGYGLPQGQISGIYGWGMDNAQRTGLDRRAAFKKLYQGWQQLTTQTSPPCHLMLAGNDTSDNLNMLIHFLTYQESSNSGSPLVYAYSFSFAVIRDYNGPANPQYIPPVGTVPLDAGTPGSQPANNEQGR